MSRSGIKFARIKPGIWETRKMRAASVHAKLIAIYLMTNGYYRMLGIYRIPKHFIEKDTGLSENQVIESLSELAKLEFCFYDDQTEVVWVCDMAMSQVAERPNAQQKKGVINELTRMYVDHEYPYVQEFIDKYRKDYSFLPVSADLLLDYSDKPEESSEYYE